MLNEKIVKLVNEIESLKKELREEIEKKGECCDYSILKGRVKFPQQEFLSQKEKLIDVWQYLKEAPIINILTAPVIYAMIIPAIILDLFLFVYVAVVYRVYKFPTIKRSDYITFDRQYLGYLNIIEKINCLYCAYFNGLINYTAAVSARTELYFCPIKHAKKIAYMHNFYHYFLPYGDAESYQKELKKCQKKAQEEV